MGHDHADQLMYAMPRPRGYVLGYWVRAFHWWSSERNDATVMSYRGARADAVYLLDSAWGGDIDHKVPLQSARSHGAAASQEHIQHCTARRAAHIPG